MTAARAKPATTPPGAPAKATGPRRRLPVLPAVLLTAALGSAAALPFCFILVPGLVPTLVAVLVDRGRPRYLGFTVGAMNCAGVLPFLLVLGNGSVTIAAAAALLAQPFTWVVAYGAAAAGWVLSAATPALARFCLELQAAQRGRAIDALARAICTEWGAEAAGADAAPTA